MNIESVKKRILSGGLVSPGDRLLCAVSGGADSVCMLHILSRMPELELRCAHFNHELRGAESDRDEEFVRALCRNMGIDFVSGSGDVAGYAREKGMGLEEAARELRYEFLQSSAARLNCSKIATAHNADDTAETVLFNLIRGSGARGLGGIPASRDNIIRPMLGFTRAEIDEYLSENGLSHIEDTSNKSEDFSRNRLRLRVIPELRRVNERAVENICSAAALLREDDDFLQSLASDFLEKNLKNSCLSVPGLLELPRPVAMRALQTLCGGGAGRVHLESIYALCLGGDVHGRTDLPGMSAVREFDLLRFGTAEEPQPIARREICPGDVLELGEAGCTIKCDLIPGCGEIHNSLNIFFFKSENICGKLSVASREEGDEIRLLGRGCTKSVRKLYSQAAMPLADRIRNPVISDGSGVIAVRGFGIAQRCAASAGDDVIRIEIIQKKR